MVRASIIRKLEEVEDPKLREVLISFLEETERIIGETVTKKEFLEFARSTSENFQKVWMAIDRLTEKVEELTEAQKKTDERINQLAEAQRRTDERLNSLSEKVEELAVAQKKTEERLNSLAQKVEELAEAQKKTEERLNSLAQKVEELTEAQKKTEERLNSLAQRVKELTEAQKKTDERINQLAEAQRRTDERLNQLAEAQKKTEEKVQELTVAQKKMEETLKKLIEEHAKTREHLGGLSNAFGYVLEDRAIKGLPKILRDRFNIQITEPLKRDIIETPDGREIEINIFGKGRVNGKELTIIGECKSQLRKRDVEKFLNYVKMLDRYITGEKFLVLVAYQTPLKIRKYIEEKGIQLVFSYELPLA